jgi:hypothetical protein
MIALRSPHQTHKKNDSTDSLNTLRKRRFLSVVSSETLVPKPAIHHLRKISELKKQAMGEITNRPE